MSPRGGLMGALCLVLSLGIHYELSPWSLLPEHEFVIRDTAGDLAIAVDLLAGDEAPIAPPPPTPPPAQESSRALSPGEQGESVDGGMRSAPRDAGPRKPRHDAGRRARPDTGEERDGGSPHDAGSGKRQDAPVARAGQVSGNARDAVGMIGAAGTAQAGPQNVVVTINMAVIRVHPVGRRIGPLFAAIPQWDDFLVGTGIDPLRDTDWVSINGPSLIHSEKDVIMVHYSASDAVVDRALDSIARKSPSGGPYDAGTPSVKAVLGHADRADRVFMRPQAHVVAVVPPYYAATAAKMLAHATIPRSTKHPNEALRLTLIHPHGPMPAIPETVTEVRLWIVPRASDGGADVYAEGDTATPEASEEAASVLRRVVKEQNSFGVKLITRGLLDGIELTADGSTVKMHASITREQLEVILAFSAGKLGVDIVPPDGGRPP